MDKKNKISVDNFLVPGYPDEFETKLLLSETGIPVPHGMRFLPGEKFDKNNFIYPVVVKVCSAHILHKTDRNGVVMGVESGRVEEVLKEFEKKFPNTPVLVEEQIHFRGPELIVGALVDPSFGPAVMVGAGGVLAELYKDVAFRLAPLTFQEAGRMIRELAVAPAFFGYRGLKCDPDSLSRIISATADFVIGIGESFSQLDINPLVFSDNKWIALDSKLVLDPGRGDLVHEERKINSVLKNFL
jgi:succinyl-CoA synthetase beta subunit